MTSADQAAPFDNPIWHALRGPQAAIAIGADAVLGFAIEYGPFLAVADDTPQTAGDLSARLGLRGRRHFLGAAPRALPADWRIAHREGIAQMHHRGLAMETRATHSAPQMLGPPHRQAMLDLTAIAYPEFFRVRTAELGRYLGIFVDGALVAMAGERMRLPGAIELSAICTHPDFVGRGYARALIVELLAYHRVQQLRSFLHVSEHNAQAIALYEKLGFSIRRVLPMTSIEISAG